MMIYRPLICATATERERLGPLIGRRGLNTIIMGGDGWRINFNVVGAVRVKVVRRWSSVMETRGNVSHNERSENNHVVISQ